MGINTCRWLLKLDSQLSMCPTFTDVWANAKLLWANVQLCWLKLVDVYKRCAMLLFISYKFVKRLFDDDIFVTCFFRIETYMICVNVFYVVRNEISAISDKRQRISPQNPSDFYNGCLWGNISCCRIQLKFRCRLNKKR